MTGQRFTYFSTLPKLRDTTAFAPFPCALALSVRAGNTL
jgi:hypothetical protein